MNHKNVYFNNIYTLVDKTTYDAIKQSDFLKNKFCNCQEKTHSAKAINRNGKISWTGCYLT